MTNEPYLYSRLLDMLAFKPEFIRTLWYTLLTTKAQKNQLSISILSKGIQIGELNIRSKSGEFYHLHNLF